MIFSKSPTPQAINMPFNWIADYFDGTYLSEYDFQTHKHNDFYLINQNNTLRFGLIGQGMKFFFENSDGSFYINGRYIDIGYEVNGETYILTNNNNKKDLITYKQAHTSYNKDTILQKTVIDSINFGYKTLYSNKNIECYFQPVVSLPFNDKAYIQVKITSKKDLDGNLVFISKNKVVEKFHAPLKANQAGQINWTIK